ncbi:hypothetical protein TNCV_1919061 [Trichonephila clavipes]|nr:hypothetical protein TNCV_1919061 [Trichonephila clavipes]
MEAAEMSKDKNWAILTKNPSCVARFRLLTGHACLRSHLYRIVIADTLDCTICDSGQLITTEHSDMCPALNSFNYTVEKYWRARAIMS